MGRARGWLWICLSAALWPGAVPCPAEAPSAPAAGACAAPSREATPTWVFFTDHGGETPPAALDARARDQARELTDAELLALARALPPAAWARRLRSGASALPDVHDLPLWEPHVREVARHGRLRCRSRWLNAVSIELTAAAREAVAALPCVAALRPVAQVETASFGPEYDAEGRPLETLLDVERRPAPDPIGSSRPTRERGNAPAWLDAITYGPSLGQLAEIGVPPLHRQGYSGSGVRLMMIDSGFYKEHDAFRGAEILAEWDFVFDDGETQNEPEDWPWQHHHGTGTWSVAGGFAPGRLIGPAYGATFLLAKTENPLSETRLEEDYYVAALEWGDSLGVEVTSASLNYLCFDGGFCYLPEERDGDTAVITIAVDLAAARGILCLNSLGNYGCNARTTLGTPADADSMIACGAVDSLNAITSFSACGPSADGRVKPEVVARGYYTYMAGAGIPDAYGPGSGTSFSTPLVAGAAALLMEVHPEWSAMQVREALLATADRAASPDNRYGWGRIDAQAAAAWGPLLYPRPFSLLDPADGAEAAGGTPRFVWSASASAPGQGDLAYSLEILALEGLDSGAEPDFARGVSWSFAAGPDTAFVPPLELPAGAYAWRVVAEDAAGHRRPSREVRRLRVEAPEAADAGPAFIPPAPSIALEANPFRGPLGFSIFPAQEGTSPARPTWAVYDPLGRRIASGAAGPSAEGFSARWDGSEAGGGPARPGVYYLEVKLGQLIGRETIVRLGD